MRTKVLLGLAVALMLVVGVATIGSNMGFKISIPLTAGYANYVGCPTTTATPTRLSLGRHPQRHSGQALGQCQRCLPILDGPRDELHRDQGRGLHRQREYFGQLDRGGFPRPGVRRPLTRVTPITLRSLTTPRPPTPPPS